MIFTLAELKKQVRKKADMERSNFVDDEELTFMINQSIAELYDLLTDAYQSEMYIEEFVFSTTAGTNSYDLPEDFFEMRGVDIRFNHQEWFTIAKYNFNERNRFKEASTWAITEAPNIRYRIIGDKIRFTPRPDAALEAKLWYIPQAPRLILDSDEYKDTNGWIEYVLVDAAIKCAAKEESDVSILAAQKSDLERRIRAKAMNRDSGSADSIQDVNAENDFWYWRQRS